MIEITHDDGEMTKVRNTLLLEDIAITGVGVYTLITIHDNENRTSIMIDSTEALEALANRLAAEVARHKLQAAIDEYRLTNP